MDTKPTSPELRSNEVEDILGKVPGWTSRFGIVLILAVVALLFLFAWFYRIPEVTKATITITCQYPSADTETGSKIADNLGELVGTIILSTKGVWEVEKGQQVNIRFPSYPYLEYGTVEGVVSNVSEEAENDLYTIEVALTDGLTTHFGNTLDFTQNMQGEAEILTHKARLIQRIFNPIGRSAR